MAAAQYFIRTSTAKFIGNANVLQESETPLILAGVKPGVGNYLLYEYCPLKYLMARFSSTRLSIQGEVFGGSWKSCIMPRAIFWGSEKYIDETGHRYLIEGQFDITLSFVTPPETLNVTPMITFDASCFLEGQKILLKDVRWY